MVLIEYSGIELSGVIAILGNLDRIINGDTGNKGLNLSAESSSLSAVIGNGEYDSSSHRIHRISLGEKINNDVYFYYLNDGEEGLTQSTVDFIDAIAAANGFGFDGKATADAAREAYEKELGVYEICQKYTEPQWTDIK